MFKKLLAVVACSMVLFVQADTGASSAGSKKKAHSAGYNAYCVGYNSANGYWQLFPLSQPPSQEYIDSLSYPMKQYMQAIRNSYNGGSECLRSAVLDNEIPVQLKGGSLYFGYGMSPTEMAEAGRFSLVYAGL